MNANTDTTDDESPDTSEAVAQIMWATGGIVFFDDGEHLRLYEGGSKCSEHGHLDSAHGGNVARCTHEYDVETTDVPTFGPEVIRPVVTSDRETRDAAIDAAAEQEPELVVDVANQIIGHHEGED